MNEAASQNWLRWDCPKEVVASLSHLSNCIALVETDPAAWKWAILALHNALQGAMTCHLTGTAGVGHLSQKSAEEWLAWYEAKDPNSPPRIYQAKPEDLFKRLHRPQSRVEANCGRMLTITPKQKNSFKILNDLRNEFTHFSIDGWGLELSSLPQIFDNILDIIYLISEDDWPFRHMAADERAELGKLLTDLSQSMVKLASSR